jgi:hypothetical protein
MAVRFPALRARRSLPAGTYFVMFRTDFIKLQLIFFRQNKKQPAMKRNATKQYFNPSDHATVKSIRDRQTMSPVPEFN